jgi:sporulation protein YlmC with PRC-barrel domain
MNANAEYTIGASVACSDGACGKLSRVVVDPVARSLTHLVVEPPHHLGLSRLVPIELVESAGEEIALSCSKADFDELEAAEEARFLSESERFGYAPGEVLAWPYYGLGRGIGGIGLAGMGMGGAPQSVTFDRVPVGEVAVRRDEHVHASDGAIGRIQGLVIDPSDHHVTHVLLQEGHLWGKKELAIPIGAVEEVAEDGVRLSLSKDQVRDLPAIEVAPHT